MTYIILDTLKAEQVLKPFDKINSIDGESLTLYLTEVAPEAATRMKKRLIEPSLINISPFDELNSSGVPQYDTDYDCMADVIWKESKRYDAATGAETTVSRGTLTFLRPKGTHKSKILIAYFHDRLDGFTFSDQFTVSFVNVTETRDWRGQVGTPTTSTLNLNCDMVTMKEGFMTEDGVMLINGTAMIKVSRDQITREQINANPRQSYFNIALNGASPVKYYIWNSPEGNCVEKSHFLNIYLNREMR